jgi:hypothetical protein
MAFPATRAALKASGYRFENHSICRGCKEPIEWWTSPKGRKMPFQLMAVDDSPALAHFVYCPNAEDFRSGSTGR